MLASKLFVYIALGVPVTLAGAGPALCQGEILTPITLHSANQALAQAPPREAVPNPTVIPTDVTPVGIGQERELIRPGWRFYLMQKLPPRMWFTSSTEVTQRLETNVFFTERDQEADYVFRVNPNCTLGYDLRQNTSAYCNYFVIKDVFADHGVLSYPTTQSLSMGLRQQIPIRARTNIQLDYQVRELWQAVKLRQADMIPGVTITRVFTPKLIGFANINLQMRSRNIFQGPTREIDPFYTLGMLYRWRQWNFLLVDTYVSNFRYRDAIPNQSNQAMIAEFEASHPISKKLPGVVAFLRCEPIWNWGAHGTPGLSGFDFRLFSGLRISFNKPSYYASLNKLRQQLKEAGKEPVTRTSRNPASDSHKQSIAAKFPQEDPQEPPSEGKDSASSRNSSEQTSPTDGKANLTKGVADLH
ncbi:MAG TPA: hypothetical protein V6D17_11825 [Candidatus Obscuribacterales bacterium]